MQLRNTNPLGAVDLPLIGRQGEPFGEEGVGCLEPGEVFEIDDERGNALLEQAGNYEVVGTPKPETARGKGRQAAARKRAAKKTTSAKPAPVKDDETPAAAPVTDAPAGDVAVDTVKGEAQ